MPHTGKPLRAAVIGASGIGKHHAKWFHHAGCELVAFCGTSEETTAKTAAALADLFGFHGRSYCDCDQMLAAEAPDLVSVCTPPQLHHQHVTAALSSGAHVMCEKPLVWGDPDDFEGLIAQGEQLVSAARRADRLLAVNTQYAAGVEAYYDFLGDRPGTIESFFMRIESRAARPGRDTRTHDDIWIDLASHPLSVLMAFVPDGEVDWNTATCELHRDESLADFDYVSPTTGRCRARIEVGNALGDQLIRRFGINDALVDYEGRPSTGLGVARATLSPPKGRNDEQGVFCAYLSRGGRERKFGDFVQTSLTRFIAAARGEGAQLLATGADGLKNLELQLRLMALAASSARS